MKNAVPSGLNPAKNMMFFYALISIVVVIIVISLLRRTGILQSRLKRQLKKEKQIKKSAVKNIAQTVNESKLYEPNYYKDFSPGRWLSDSDAEAMTKTLRKAMRFMGTNESEIFGVFRSLTDKIQVSQLADKYADIYQRDLASDLSGELNKNELYDLNQIVQSI